MQTPSEHSPRGVLRRVRSGDIGVVEIIAFIVVSIVGGSTAGLSDKVKRPTCGAHNVQLPPPEADGGGKVGKKSLVAMSVAFMVLGLMAVTEGLLPVGIVVFIVGGSTPLAVLFGRRFSEDGTLSPASFLGGLAVGLIITLLVGAVILALIALFLAAAFGTL